MITFMHCKAVVGSRWVRVRVSYRVRFSVRVSFRLGLVSGLYKWLFYLATVR